MPTLSLFLFFFCIFGGYLVLSISLFVLIPFLIFSYIFNAHSSLINWCRPIPYNLFNCLPWFSCIQYVYCMHFPMVILLILCGWHTWNNSCNHTVHEASPMHMFSYSQNIVLVDIHNFSSFPPKNHSVQERASDYFLLSYQLYIGLKFPVLCVVFFLFICFCVLLGTICHDLYISRFSDFIVV